MKNNGENIPSYIFDWMELYSFKKLEKGKQQEVLAYLSAEEYEGLHQNLLLIKQHKFTDKNAKNEESKILLLNEFHKKHPRQNSKNILMAPVSLWKAAVIILVVGAAWIFTSYKKFSSQGFPSPAAFIDTVYIEKEVLVEVPVKIYDTIFKEKKNDFIAIKHSNKISEKTIKSKRLNPTGNIVQQYKSAEHIVSINEIENLSNQPKRNSVKDDSLIKNYTFVQL